MATACCGIAIGLIDPRPASNTLRQFVIDALDLSSIAPDLLEIKTSAASRHSDAGYTCVRDLIMWADPGGEVAFGKVCAHLSVNDEPITLVQPLHLRSHEPLRSTAILVESGIHDVIDTASIIDALTWANYDEGVVKALLPRNCV